MGAKSISYASGRDPEGQVSIFSFTYFCIVYQVRSYYTSTVQSPAVSECSCTLFLSFQSLHLLLSACHQMLSQWFQIVSSGPQTHRPQNTLVRAPDELICVLGRTGKDLAHSTLYRMSIHNNKVYIFLSIFLIKEKNQKRNQACHVCLRFARGIYTYPRVLSTFSSE